MVWGLFPVDPLPGEDKYYIFSKGIYKVGRKGCDIIINKDKGVSRVHAEIIVDEMICMDDLKMKYPNASSKVRIRDCSKYGTFIDKNMGSKAKLHEFTNKEAILKDGDLISFGTGSATYRFCFISLVFFISSFNPLEMKQLEDKISCIGASLSRGWTVLCTHMIVNDFITLTHQIIDVVVSKGTLVQPSWLEFIAGKTIYTEIPSSLLHATSLTLEGLCFKVSEPQSQADCLKEYTFLLESLEKYMFKERLQLLLDLGGAKSVFTETLDPDGQSFGEVVSHVVHIVPTGSAPTKSFHKMDLGRNIKEVEVVAAVLSGSLDPSIIASAPVLVTSSCSTDETVVADSDVEVETATSIRTSAVVNLINSDDDASPENITLLEEKLGKNDFGAGLSVQSIKSPSHDDSGKTAAVASIDKRQGFIISKSETVDATFSVVGNDKTTTKTLSPENANIDIIFSQQLIVRGSIPTRAHSSSNDVAVNFKRFRKINAPSGNSFNSLVPFSKHPYGEADYRNEDVVESIKAEKKRKQMEAVSDDLFNNEKLQRRKRGTIGSLGGVLLG